MTAGMDDMRDALDHALPDVRAMGLMMFDPVWGEREHKARGLEILHVVSGRLDLVQREGTYSAGPGDTLLIPDNEPHMDVFDTEAGLEVFFCSVLWPWEKRLCGRVKNRDLRAMPQHVKAELVGMSGQLRTTLSSTAPPR